LIALLKRNAHPYISVWAPITEAAGSTRKLSYRKDDRVMRHYMGALKIFVSLSMPTATYPENFNGLLFRSILWMCVGLQHLNFVTLPVP